MNEFSTLEEIIRNRRSTKPALFNGRKIDDNQVKELLELANWAPTHGYTEPWRFIVYTGAAIPRFGQAHARLYQQHTPPEKFNPGKYEKLQHNGDKTSHLIAVYNHGGTSPNIPELEEICATAAAVQNLLLGARALGIAVLWSTGGMTLHPAMAAFLGLAPEDRMIGLLYLGYTDEPAAGGKRQPVTAKTTWFDH